MTALFKIIAIYVLGLCILFGSAVYVLFFSAIEEPDYAFWIIVPLAWTCSYFPTVMPLFTVYRIRKFLSALEASGDLLAAAKQAELGEDDLINFVHQHSGLPKFVLRRFYPMMKRRIAEQVQARPAQSESDT